MSWDEVMRRVLPPMRDDSAKKTYPHITSPYGTRTDRPPGSSNPHVGVDFNYLGGQQSRFNTSHPALRSPIAGRVINAGEGDYGTIAIRDANGYTHELLHTQRRHVSIGDPVVAGQLIGTMGNTGVDHRGVEGGQYHVHYQIKDRDGNRVNPVEFWDSQGPIDPNPAPPAVLRDYLQYQRGLGSTVDAAFNNAPVAGPRYGPQPVDAAQPGPGAPGQPSTPPARGDVRILRSRPANVPVVSGLQVGPAATAPNEMPPPDRAPSFSDRFGSWASSAGVNAPLSPYQQFAPPPQSAGPLGVVAGRPTPDYPFAPPIWGSQTPGLENWAALQRKQASWPKGD